jgi:hypothetical protein
MTSKSVRKEPFLNAVARKLGHAAGTLTNVAQGLSENLSVLPKAGSKMVSTNPTTEPAGGRKSSRESKRTARQAAGTRGTSRIAGTRKPKPGASKTRRPAASLKRGKKKT